MKYSKQQLQNIAHNTGFRAEIIEKVFLLMDLLSIFIDDHILKESLVLKGGTALNLFYLDLPRLSVDIDLNFIGAVNRDKMLQLRANVEERISILCQSQGFAIFRKPTAHAGGKVVWRYPSAFGNTGNLEIDLNFMYRIPLLPIQYKHSSLISDKFIKNIPVLDIHELAAGKLVAFINRALGRDLFDTYNLLTNETLDIKILRLIFTIYLAINKVKDFQLLSPEIAQIDYNELHNRLLPLLSRHVLGKTVNKEKWVEQMLSVVRLKLKSILPLRKNELSFLDALLNFGEIKPILLTGETALQEKIKSHPGIIWAAYNAKKTS